MTPTQIEIESFVVPVGTRPARYAEHQPEYIPLDTICTPDGKVVSQWQPTAEELQAIVEGRPITLVVWTFNQPLQPVCVAVGGLDLR